MSQRQQQNPVAVFTPNKSANDMESLQSIKSRRPLGQNYMPFSTLFTVSFLKFFKVLIVTDTLM